MQYRSLMHRTARMYADLPAIICADRTLSFTEMVDRATRLGNALADAGCEVGDRIGVFLPNCPEYMEIDAGLAAAGLVRVSLNIRSTTRQQIDVLTDAGVTALIYDEQFAPAASEILQELDGLRRVLRLRGGSDEGEIRDYEAALSTASGAPLPADPSGDDLYCLFYTSGTSGTPEGGHALPSRVLLGRAPPAARVRPGRSRRHRSPDPAAQPRWWLLHAAVAHQWRHLGRDAQVRRHRLHRADRAPRGVGAEGGADDAAADAGSGNRAAGAAGAPEDHLRRLADAGATARRAARAVRKQVHAALRPGRGADDDHRARPRGARQGRPAPVLGRPRLARVSRCEQSTRPGSRSPPASPAR